MINHMEEVAKMLGVELGEEFEVGLCRVRYVLTEEGLFCASSKREANNMLKYILTGEVEVKPWK